MYARLSEQAARGNAVGEAELLIKNFPVNLRSIFQSSQAHERLEDSKLEAVSDNNLELVNEILEDISPLINKDENIAELVGILKEPHFLVRLLHS